MNLTECVDAIHTRMINFKTETQDSIFLTNKSAQARARNATREMTKLCKEFRRLSIEHCKNL